MSIEVSHEARLLGSVRVHGLHRMRNEILFGWGGVGKTRHTMTARNTYKCICRMNVHCVGATGLGELAVGWVPWVGWA